MPSGTACELLLLLYERLAMALAMALAMDAFLRLTLLAMEAVPLFVTLLVTLKSLVVVVPTVLL